MPVTAALRSECSNEVLAGRRTGDDEGVIGRLHHAVLDCPDPAALAEFYSQLLGWPVTYRSAEWVVVAENDTTSGLAFQLAPDHLSPAWPDPARPQQVHFDVMVEDPDEATRAVVALGARLMPEGDHVFADPAGHPFCLIRRPQWAPPIAMPFRDGAPGVQASAEAPLQISHGPEGTETKRTGRPAGGGVTLLPDHRLNERTAA